MKKAIGKIKCLSCGDSMPAMQSDTGTIDLSCKMCGLSAYAKPGTDAHRAALARITDKRQIEMAIPAPAKPAAVAPPAPAKPRAPAPAPAPAKPASMAELPASKRNTLFG